MWHGVSPWFVHSNVSPLFKVTVLPASPCFGIVVPSFASNSPTFRGPIAPAESLEIARYHVGCPVLAHRKSSLAKSLLHAPFLTIEGPSRFHRTDYVLWHRQITLRGPCFQTTGVPAQNSRTILGAVQASHSSPQRCSAL